MLLRFCLASAILAASGTAQAEIPWWTGTYEEAFQEAERRNVPVLVAFIQDGEEANERIISGLYTDPTFIKLVGQVVPVIASIAVHRPKKSTTGNEVRVVCSRFGTVSCKLHKAHELEARGDFWTGASVKTPAHIWVLPDRTEHDRLVDVHPAAVFEDHLRRIRKKIGPGITREAYKQGAATLALALQSFEKGQLAEAVAGVSEIERTIGGGTLRSQATELQAKIIARAEEILARATELATAGETMEALRSVEECRVSVRGTPTEGKIRDFLARLRRTPEGRAAHRLLRADAEVRPLLTRAATLERERDFVRAARDYARVVERAFGSPAASEASARLDAFHADPDVRALIEPILAEYHAQRALEQAQALIKDGKKEDGEKELRSLMQKWPGTKAANRAQRTLGQRP